MERVGRDLLWKGIIESLFEDFLHFFFPDLATQVDFSKPFVFLDKELEQLFPESASRNRLVDKLVKVFLLDGRERWILIHVEIQGYRDVDFAERMFIYYYRIRDRYRRPLTTLAVLTDRDPNYHPRFYEVEFAGTKVYFIFNTYKVLEQDLSKLTKSKNLFAVPIEIALISLSKPKLPGEQLLDIKLEIIRRMRKRGFSRVKISHLLRFMQYYIRFDDREIYHKFEEEINNIFKTAKPMGITEIIEEQLKKKGREEGLKQGLEQGLELGINKATQKIVANAWRKGLSVAMTAELTDLSEEEVANLYTTLSSEEE